MSITRISRTTAINTLRNNPGKIVTIIADTQRTKNRIFNCNYKAGSFTTPLMMQGVLRVYDMKKKSERNINVRNIKSITVNKATYVIGK